MLIITADDYGKDIRTTDNILRCGLAGRISCASAMVFMDDSVRAASMSRGSGIEIGLHLNFTTPFHDRAAQPALAYHQERVIRYLTSVALAQALYNPFLVQSFRILFQAQIDEFFRLYDMKPDFYNGHHHMHLCANVLRAGLLPRAARVRGTFTLGASEKSSLNRWYRRRLDRLIAQNYVSTRGFFTIAPVSNHERIAALLRRAQLEDIEIEVHPEIQEETEFLLGEKFRQMSSATRMCRFTDLAGCAEKV